MAKRYTVIVRRRVSMGDQHNQDERTYIVTLTKQMLRTRKEAENLREVYHKMSQEVMVNKFGEGFYHGLEIVEHDVHVPGEALLKWQQCKEMFTERFLERMCKVLEGKSGHILLTVQRTGEEPFVTLLSLVIQPDGKYTGAIGDFSYLDCLGQLMVHGFAKVMELKPLEFEDDSENKIYWVPEEEETN